MKFTKSFLQGLSTDDLLQLANDHSLFLSPDLTRRLLIGELLDIEDEAGESGDREQSSDDDSGTVGNLVGSGNATEIHVVLKNPIWFFTFWNFNAHLYTSLTESKNFSHFFLRVHSLDVETKTKSLDSFDIQIPSTDRKRYVHVSFDEYVHRVDLMVRFLDEREQVLAQSNEIGMKRNTIPQRLCVAQNNVNTVCSLSGLRELKKSHFKHYRRAFV